VERRGLRRAKGGPHRRQEFYKVGRQNLVPKNYLENSDEVLNIC
jgi:hypothetical protein